MEDKVTQADLAAGYSLAAWLPGAFVSGSAILDLDTAKDVDVVVPASSWSPSAAFLQSYGLESYEPLEDAAYAADVTANEIVALYRGRNKINVIVVSDLYYPAYKAGELEYLRNPQLYVNSKPVREALHKDMKAEIRSMLDGSWQEKHRTPVAVTGPHGMPVFWGFGA
jgi:hypothetical protein